MPPRISIVTPNLNGGRFLERTILSVINQGYPNLEYIVIDGGSTDDSVEIIKKYEDHISYWRSEKDHGIYDALNFGFQLATGDLMGWLNSDDVYHENALALVCKLFSVSPTVQWITGATSWIDHHNHVVKVKPSRDWTKTDVLAGHWKYIQQESTFWTAKAWHHAGSCFNLRWKYAGDFDLWLRLFEDNQLYVCDTLLGSFRMHDGCQISQKFRIEYDQEGEQLIREMKERLPFTLQKKVNRTVRLYRIQEMLALVKCTFLSRCVNQWNARNRISSRIIYDFDQRSYRIN